MAYIPLPSRRPERVCSFYGTAIGCRKGPACPFLHLTEPHDPRDLYAATSAPYAAVGIYGAVGYGATVGTYGVHAGGYGAPAPAPDAGTRACAFWAERGFCKKGDACPFSHLGAPGSMSGVGGGRRESYVNGEAPVCTFWAERGSCKKGDTCNFSHAGMPGSARVSAQRPAPGYPYAAVGTLPYDPIPSMAPSPYALPMAAGGGRGGFAPILPAPRAKFCAFYNEGKCKKGPQCDHLHVVIIADDAPTPERRVCAYFKEGSCKKGNQCDHLHVVRESEKEEVEKRIERSMAERLEKVCPFFWSASCKKGMACDTLHLMPRQRAPPGARVCQYFEASRVCKKNNQCEFLHVVDRPTSDMPLDVGFLSSGGSKKRELEEEQDDVGGKRARRDDEEEEL